MHQFKQFIGSLPRHVPTKPVAASGCPQNAEALLTRGGHRYLCSYKPGSVYAASCTDEHRIGDECAKTFPNGKSKIALYHERNTPLNRIVKLEDSGHRRAGIAHGVAPRISKEKPEGEASRSSSLPRPIPPKLPRAPRTYAQMIAEYSEWLEKKKLADRAKEAAQPKGLLAKLPFDAVVSSLAKLERPKLGRNRSSSGEPGVQWKGATRPLTDYGAKSEKNKTSPRVRDVQKREYNTNESPRRPKVEEGRKEPRASGPKSGRPACPKTTGDSANERTSLLRQKSSSTIKRQDSSSQWARLKSDGKAGNLNVVALGDELEVQVPIDVAEHGSSSDSRLLLLSCSVSRRSRENQLSNAAREFHTLVHSGDKRGNEARAPRALRKSTCAEDPLRPRCRSSRWRSFAEGEIDAGVQAVDATHPVIEDPPRKLLDEEKAPRPKRRRKLSGIGKITRHIEEELEEEKRKKSKTKNAQPATDNPRVERMAKDKGRKGASDGAKPEKTGKKGEKPDKRDASGEDRASDSDSIESGISLLPNSIKAGPKSKKSPGLMKPIEKRPDGTLIDFGLKVPTRKPRLGRSSSSKLPASTPKQQQQDKKVEESLALRERKKRQEPDDGGAGADSAGASPRSSGDKGHDGREAAGLAKCKGDGLLGRRPELLFWDGANRGSESSVACRYLFSPWLNRFHTRKHQELAAR